VQKEIKPFSFPAIMGNTTGDVLTGVDGIIYVTTWQGQTIKVLNRRVPNEWGRNVKVGYDVAEPGVLQVLSARNIFGKDDARPMVAEHAATHDYGGGDTDFVRASRLLYLGVLPYSGLTVQIFGGAILLADGTVFLVENQTLDLTSYKPSGGALWVVIYVDTDGSIGVSTGSTASSGSALTAADIPSLSTGLPLVAIKLYSTQTTIQRNPSGVDDFIDLRFTGSLGAGVDASLVSYSPAVLADWDYLTDPGQVDDALDQLASRTTDLETSIADIEATTPTTYEQFVWMDDGAGSWEFVSFDDGDGHEEPLFMDNQLE